MRTLELPLDDGPTADLDELLEEIAAAVDASFLRELQTALQRTAGAPAEPAAALG